MKWSDLNPSEHGWMPQSGSVTKHSVVSCSGVCHWRAILPGDAAADDDDDEWMLGCLVTGCCLTTVGRDSDLLTTTTHNIYSTCSSTYETFM